MKKLYAVLLISFLIISSGFSQSITVTSPNGGESWAGCTSQNITWNASGTSDFYTIEYSTDSGTTWTSVTSFYNTTSGSYNWTVPNTESTKCLVRIKDSNTPSTIDTSNAVFSITKPVIVTTPDGGEDYEAVTTQPITWASTGTSDYYTIEYSTNAGSTWTTIVSNYYNTSGTYNWNVPNTPSTQCLVQVTDYQDGCKTDKSDNLFTISPPSPVLTLNVPNGGQTWYVGTSYNITWSSQYLTSSFVDLEYSTNNGATWTTIVTATADDGSHSWNVPNFPSTQCLIRVSENGTPAVNDQSNAVFTMANPSITVNVPNGGETWYGCYSYNITWTRAGVSDFYNIDYSTDNGTTWTSITSFYNTTGSSYNWSVPDGVNSTQCLVRVKDSNNSTVRDSSNSVFTINANSDVIISSPNGGENLEAMTVQPITWAAANVSNYYTIQYSTDGGATWTNIVNNYYNTSGTYNWSVPNVPSSTCLIRIYDYQNSCKDDYSDATFTIDPPTPIITVNYPNGGNTFYVGTSYNITWSSAYLSSAFVVIEYSIDNGSSWTTIASSTNDDGSYSWLTPNFPSAQCLIRVSDFGNSSTNDVSNAVFSIVSPFITVTNPNGGEVVPACTTKTIQWTRGGTSNYFIVEYTSDGGTTWNTLNSNYYSSSSSPSYSWSYPPSISSTNCYVKVTDKNDLAILDSSDASFTITPSTNIIITSPNGGENWEAATTQSITWASSGTSNYYTIQYSVDGGSIWNTIVSAYYNTSGVYNWNVPNNPSSNCKIRIYDYYNTCKEDTSDAVFTIDPPTPVITVNYPNGGNTFYAGTSYNITWSSAYLSSAFVVLEYSTDNGSTWTSIVSSTNDDGSYTWLTPNTPSAQCLVRVSDFGNSATNDVSNAVFSIVSPFITLTNPNGGEIVPACTTKTIQWTRGGTSNYFIVEYTSDGGTTWNTLNSNYYSSSSSPSYSWSYPPSISSSNCYVKITDKNDLAVLDSSNASFTITPSTNIIITSPNGGENWEAATTQSITWAASGTSNYYTIQYSVDGGSIWNTIVSAYYNTSGVYNWNVPNNPSTNCKIRIYDYYNTCKEDTSDAVFTIDPPTPVITVNYPNGGNTFYAGTSYNITWSSAYLTSAFVMIEYSTDNGSTWTTIIASTNDDGSFSWLTPAAPSTQCLIRVSEFGNASVNDVSNAVFTIIDKFITVTNPNGGETVPACTTKTIQWTRGGTSNYFIVEYTDDGGTTWITLNSNYYSSSSSPSYSWSYPPSISSSNCYVKITDKNDLAVLDSSDASFTITPSTNVIITSPNGGENWEAATTQPITWASSGTSNYYTIQYSVDGGSIWNTIVSAYYNTTGVYNWNVPNNPSSNCKIRIYDYYNTCKEDTSDAVFTIDPPTPVITVNYPNGGNTFYAGTSYNITWSSAFLSSAFVVIEYSTDNGSSWTSIVTSTNDDGTYSWLVPNTPSAQCLVRVSDFGNSATNDVSNAVFNIVSPFITVTNPNGGEIVPACTTKTIQWTRGGTSNYFIVEYTSDGGTTWNTLNSNYYSSSSSPSYSWSYPPSISSANCYVKITDKNNVAVLDSSDASFTITPSTNIIITSPNGGENWEAATTQTITWASSGTSNYYTIQYSIDGGNTWSNIVSAYYNTSGAYNWNVPNNPSSNCLIRIYDYYNSCKEDESDAIFTIDPPTPVITVNYPNGGNTFYVGSSINITWSSAYLSSSFVTISYSTDNGATWTNIVSPTNDDGSHNWIIPNTPSTQCLVKVNDYNTPSTNDVSNAVFSILSPFITVTNPNGGETVPACTTKTVQWTRGGTSNYFRLEYSVDSGATWTTLNSNYYSSSSSPSYSWSYPPSLSSNDCYIRISDANDPATIDLSDNVFTITPNNSIIISAPNGGEQYEAGTTQPINWASSGTSNYYTIQYSVNGGATWSNIVTSYYNTTGNYNWSVPNLPSSNCLIKIYDYYNSCKEDVSDSLFEITPPTPVINVNFPNGGNSLCVGTSYNITWSSAYLSSSFVVIDYSIDNGVSWQSVTTVTNNDGSHLWVLPQVQSDFCLIRITDYGNPLTYDISNAVFSIDPAIRLISPNGDNGIEDWGACTVTSITWDRCGTGNYFRLEYSIDSGNTWMTINSSYYSTSSTPSYSWTLPNTPSTKCLVKVTDTGNSSKTDKSDSTFTISPAITVTQPNYGGTVVVGTTSNITWNYDGTSNYYNIDYSTNGGVTWTNIVFNYYNTSGTYAWTVPNTPSTQALIRITDNNNTCKQDLTDNFFTISSTPPAIEVQTPNGGESLTGCNTYNITWVESSVSGSFNIDYSLNGGSTWNNIATATAIADSSYLWTVPNVQSNTCLVRVTDSNDGTKLDQSNAAFAINPGLIAGVSASGPLSICAGDSVTLTSLHASGNTWNPNGETSSSITINSSGTYSVTVDSSGCIAQSADQIVQVNALPSTPTISADGPLTFCEGDDVILTSSAASGNSWTPNSETTTAILVDTTGDYSVTVTDLNGCSSTSAITSITVNPIPGIPTVSASGATVFCVGDSVILTSSSATNNIWSPNGETTQSITVNSSGSYSVTVDNGTCDASSSATTVTVNPLPTPSISAGGPLTFCDGENVMLTSSAASGNTWNPTSETTQSIFVSTSGSFYVVETDINGCIDSSNTLTVLVNTLPPVPTITASGPVVFCQGDSVRLNSDYSSGNSWTPGLENSVSIYVFTGGSYSVTHTDSNSCSSSSNPFAVTVNSNPTASVSLQTNVTCPNDLDGDATVDAIGGSLPYNYFWDNGQTNQTTTGLSSGSYYVTVTDANSCTDSSSVTIGTATTINISDSLEYCKTETDVVVLTGSPSGGVWTGSAGVTIYGDDSLDVDNTPWTLTSPHTLTYSVSGCTDTTVLNITGSKAGLDTVVCVSDGPFNLATPSPAGGFWYSVGSGGLQDSLTGMIDPSGLSGSVEYVYIHTGCADTLTVDYNSFSFTLVSTAESCSPGSDGSATVATVSGDLPFSFLWSEGSTDSTISSLANGQYGITITDGNGCSDSSFILVDTLFGPNLSVVSDTLDMCVGDSVIISANGALSYLWSPSNDLVSDTDSSTLAFPSANTSYTVTGTSNGCQDSLTIYVQVHPTPLDPVISLSGPAALCAGDSVIMSSSYSTGNVWNSGENTQSITVTTSGNYSVEYADVFGCMSYSDTVTVTVSPLPTISPAGPLTICTGDSTLLTSSSTSNNLWSTGETTSSIYVSIPGNYSVAVTDSTGCTASSLNVDVSNTDLTTLNAGNDLSISYGDSIALNASGADSYTWNFSTTLSNLNIENPVASPTATTMYYVTGQDSNGCSAVDSVTVNVVLPAPPVADFTADVLTISPGGTVNFFDLSTNNPTSWSYSFSGGTPGTSSSQNPTNISWNSVGCYDVTLIVSNVGGSDTVTKICYITVDTTSQNLNCGPTVSGCPGGTASTVIGTGVTSNAATGYPAPYGNWYWGSKHQMLYTAAELQAAGFTSGTITEISFDITANTGTNAYNAFELKMGCTSLTDITTFQTGLTTVFPSQNITVATGTNTHVLATPYDWDGSSNIIIEVCFNNSAFTNNAETPYTTTTFSSVVYYRGDNATVCSNNTVTGTSTNRPNITFTTCNAGTTSCPVISVSTNGTDPACGNGIDGSITASALSGGAGTITDDFDGGADMSNWNAITGATANTNCGSVSGDALHFDGTTRIAETMDLNTVNGGDIDFSIIFGSGSAPCEAADAGEDVVLEYSNDGGAIWTIINTYDESLYTTWTAITQAIPSPAQTSSTRFRWRQLTSSGTGFDNWALDDVSIPIQSGAAGSYSYLWSNGQTGATATGLGAGTYAVTATDSSGCTGVGIATLTSPTAVSIAYSFNAPTCGQADGNINASASGGSGAYTYNWSTGSTLPNVTSLTAGTFSLTVTDSNGCTDTTSISLNSDQPVLLMTSSDITCFGNMDGNAGVAVSAGLSPYAYLWSNGDTTTTISNLIGGTFVVTVTDDNGCAVIDSVNISEPAQLTSTATVTSDVNCNGGSDGIATISSAGGSGTYSYSWSNGSTSGSATGLAAGTHTITISDSQNCSITDSVTISEPSSPITVSLVSSTDADCNGAATGSASVGASGGTSAYTYLWPNGETNSAVTGIAAGNHVVTVTDANSCSDSLAIAISEPFAIELYLDSTEASCNQADGGANVVVAGGNAPYTYLWSSGGTTNAEIGLSAGVYTVTVTDSTACSNSGSIQVTEIGGLNASITSSVDVSCNGMSDGSAVAAVTGGTSPYIYQWSAGSTDLNISGLGSGTFGFTVTDSLGCNSTDSATINEPATLTLSLSTVNDVSCFNGNDGSASASVSGGNGNYSYVWTSGNTASIETGLIAGVHYVTVSDSLSCSASDSIAITEPSQVAITSTGVVNPLCAGSADGQAAVSASGGNGGFTYLWSDGQISSTATGLTAGTYGVTATDSSGCSANLSGIQLNDPIALTATTSSTTATCTNADGSATVTAGGGTTPYGYLWSEGSTTSTINGITGGNYSVTVTDANGCVANASETVGATAGPVVSISASTDVSCFGGNDGSATASASGGTPNYVYSWPGGGFLATETGLSTGIYVVTVTDNNGCVATNSVTIGQPSLLVVNTTAINISCFGELDGSVSASASGGTPNYTYNWSTGSTGANIASLGVGSYTVTATDANGCTATSTATIAEPGEITLVASSVAETSNCNGSASVSQVGGQAPFNYQWDANAGNQITSTATGLCAGDYTCTVTDANGCSGTITVTVDNLVSISSIDNDLDMVLFPNPNNGHFSIKFSDRNNHLTQMTVIDISGKVVWTRSLKDMEANQLIFEVHLDHIATGIYTLVVEGEQGRWYRQLGVQ